MYLLKQRPLFSFAAFYGAGVITAYLTGMPSFVLLISGAICGLLSIAALCVCKGRRLPASAALIFFFLAVACSGGAYMAASLEKRPEFETRYNAEFSGTVAGSPYLDENGERFVCDITELTINGASFDFDMRLYLRGDNALLNSISCGQQISGKGHTFYPEPSSNPHEFDFGDYLWREGLAGYITAKENDVEISGEGGGLAAELYAVRAALSMRIDAAFPRSTQLVRALVLGDKRDMSDDIRKDFNAAGVAHLLAISGLHITLAAAAISYLLKFITGIRPATIATLIGIIIYGAIIGFSPSVTRAIIMYAVLCGAPVAGRPNDGCTRLALAFLIILLIDPLNIADPGFVLSFMASAGLIWICKPLMRLLLLDRIGRGRSIWSIIAAYPAQTLGATLAAQLFTYPALAAFYGKFSVVSIFSNLLLVPLCLVALIASYIGLAIPPLAFVGDRLLVLLRNITGICAGLEWAEVSVAAPQIWLWIGMFAAALIASDISKLPYRLKPFVILLMPVMIIISIFTAVQPGMSVIFLDVGQADSAVVRADDITCVIDVGEDGSEVTDYIQGEGLTVDMLFLSHPHSDHAGGLGEVIAECDIERIYIPAGWFEEMDGAELTAEWQTVISAGIPFVELSPGDEVRLTGDALLRVLGSAVDTGDPCNDLSLIILLDCGDSEVLFTGDANPGAAPDVDILKIGHHGSKTATDRTVLDSATPKAAIISVGRNSYGHPSPEVLELLEEYSVDIYRTDECGAVTVILDKDGDHEISVFREEH